MTENNILRLQQVIGSTVTNGFYIRGHSPFVRRRHTMQAEVSLRSRPSGWHSFGWLVFTFPRVTNQLHEFVDPKESKLRLDVSDANNAMPEKIPLLGEYCLATEACQNRYLLLCSPSLSPHMMDSAIQWPWKALMVVQILMHWIVFHDPVDRVIQLLNNQGLGSNRTEPNTATCTLP